MLLRIRQKDTKIILQLRDDRYASVDNLFISMKIEKPLKNHSDNLRTSKSIYLKYTS